MTDPNTPDSEDRRRPRALVPYILLWSAAGACVIFALVVMLNQP